jgi:SNF family Na+-dependent transporter
MENNKLSTIWNKQTTSTSTTSKQLILKAKNQRRKQIIGIIVMITTVMIVASYGVWQTDHFNTFALGICLMVAALSIRIIIEWLSNLNKLNGLTHMSGRAYLAHLHSFYKRRKITHYVITPLCFGTYVIGLLLLFPYFKIAFSSGFYLYLVVSGIVSLAVIILIIIRQASKELTFLRELR